MVFAPRALARGRLRVAGASLLIAMLASCSHDQPAHQSRQLNLTAVDAALNGVDQALIPFEDDARNAERRQLLNAAPSLLTDIGEVDAAASHLALAVERTPLPKKPLWQNLVTKLQGWINSLRAALGKVVACGGDFGCLGVAWADVAAADSAYAGVLRAANQVSVNLPMTSLGSGPAAPISPVAPYTSAAEAPPATQTAQPSAHDSQPPPPTQPAPRSGAEIYVVNCRGGSAATRPPTFYLACGDGGISLTDISWRSWGGPTARGSGVLNELSCKPNCATGGVGSEPAVISLSRAGTVDTVEAYRYAVVTPAPPNPQGFQPIYEPLPG